MKIKAYAVVNTRGEIEKGDMLEKDADCACRAMSFDVMTVFETRAMANLYRSYDQKVISIILTQVTKKR